MTPEQRARQRLRDQCDSGAIEVKVTAGFGLWLLDRADDAERLEAEVERLRVGLCASCAEILRCDWRPIECGLCERSVTHDQ